MNTTQQVPRPDTQGAVAPRPKPSSAWYAIGALIATVGIVVGLAWGLTIYFSYRDDIRAFARMQTPGTAELILDAGGQTIYFEGSQAQIPTTADIHITSGDGSSVVTSSYVDDVRYDAPDGSVGKAVATIVVPTDGTYRVVAEGPVGLIAIGDAVTSSTIVSVIGAMFLALGSLATGTVLIVVVAIKRSKTS